MLERPNYVSFSNTLFTHWGVLPPNTPHIPENNLRTYRKLLLKEVAHGGKTESPPESGFLRVRK